MQIADSGIPSFRFNRFNSALRIPNSALGGYSLPNQFQNIPHANSVIHIEHFYRRVELGHAEGTVRGKNLRYEDKVMGTKVLNQFKVFLHICRSFKNRRPMSSCFRTYVPFILRIAPFIFLSNRIPEMDRTHVLVSANQNHIVDPLASRWGI